MAYNLFKEFELISEKAWKQQIQFDLDGKDYNSETNWTSSEGINVKPFFTSEYKSINKFYIPDNWNISQTVYLKEESISNEEIKKLISQEVYDLTIHIQRDCVNLDLLFKEVDLTYLNLYFRIDHFKESLLSTLNNYAKENKTNFHLDYDLLGGYLSTW
jgi:methylmalonyl-CoA mutase